MFKCNCKSLLIHLVQSHFIYAIFNSNMYSIFIKLNLHDKWIERFICCICMHFTNLKKNQLLFLVYNKLNQVQYQLAKWKWTDGFFLCDDESIVLCSIFNSSILFRFHCSESLERCQTDSIIYKIITIFQHLSPFLSKLNGFHISSALFIAFIVFNTSCNRIDRCHSLVQYTWNVEIETALTTIS